MNDLKLFDTVQHIKDDSITGIITHIDDNLKDVTTCNVAWNVKNIDEAIVKHSNSDVDIQWTNKLVKYDQVVDSVNQTLAKIDNMSADEFANECHKAGYTPTPKSQNSMCPTVDSPFDDQQWHDMIQCVDTLNDCVEHSIEQYEHILNRRRLNS